MPVGNVSIFMANGIKASTFDTKEEIVNAISDLIYEYDEKLSYTKQENYNQKTEFTKFFKRIYYGYVINDRLCAKHKALTSLRNAIDDDLLTRPLIEDAIKNLENENTSMHNSIWTNKTYSTVKGVYNFYLQHPNATQPIKRNVKG